MDMSAVEHRVPTGPAADPAAGVASGLNLWRSMALDLPLSLTAESMRFAGRRLEAHAEHWKALACCASVSEAIELQSGFVARTVSDYQTEADLMSRDVQKAANWTAS